MPKRQNAKGSWTESGEWAWKLDANSAALALKVDRGKYVKTLAIRPGKTSGAFEADAELVEGGTVPFIGKSGSNDVIVLTAKGDKKEGVRRITLTPLHDTRFLLLLEAEDGGGRFSRLGEVGYTRNGVDFAVGDSFPKCIVTEGKGTIKVTYKGETYYVCCSGCKELFDEKPEEILAEASAREKKSKKTDKDDK